MPKRRKQSRRALKKRERSHVWKKEKNGHYVEQEWCSVRFFQDHKIRGSVLDPFCGFGRIVIAARAAGLRASGSDIVHRGFTGTKKQNFFDRTAKIDNIVSNPDFKVFKQAALHALKLARRQVAMIMPVRKLAAARWLKDTPLKRIEFLSPRPSMPPGYVIKRGGKVGGGKQDFCFLIWDKNYRGPSPLNWLERDAHRARL